jgi:hypothetical protein
VVEQNVTERNLGKKEKNAQQKETELGVVEPILLTAALPSLWLGAPSKRRGSVIRPFYQSFDGLWPKETVQELHRFTLEIIGSLFVYVLLNLLLATGDGLGAKPSSSNQPVTVAITSERQIIGSSSTRRAQIASVTSPTRSVGRMEPSA